MNELAPPPQQDGQPSSMPPPQQVPNQPKYNSTSSLYIDSTISRPCIDEIIFCVSIVIHDRIDEGEREVRMRVVRPPSDTSPLLLPMQATSWSHPSSSVLNAPPCRERIRGAAPHPLSPLRAPRP